MAICTRDTLSDQQDDPSRNTILINYSPYKLAKYIIMTSKACINFFNSLREHPFNLKGLSSNKMGKNIFQNHFMPL